ncbi:hypothetical protein IscW_ISCW006786 [Ixodes scapularis]|uniref:Uncharacterized protein n=1 Tax=Ixodes scapularis TaxID=6945 RepID=B7PQC7_IXOSC|nr:hypothetical protein IscW_ISCW006786 [Ixodes scapularis]|eukprot:XP_002435969.1 hypothetical protein IscW_ISCW006786 [Ixodes scapularis]
MKTPQPPRRAWPRRPTRTRTDVGSHPAVAPGVTSECDGLQCSVVEELIAFSALDNLKDLACVSVLALCLDQVQLQVLERREAQCCLQVVREASQQQQGAGGQSPLLGRRSDPPLLVETSVAGQRHGVATLTLGAAHMQLRRLRNCTSSLLKEATVTCVAPHHSKVMRLGDACSSHAMP